MSVNLFLLLFSLFLPHFSSSLSPSPLKLVCYLTNDENVTTHEAKLLPEGVDPHLCTHVFAVAAVIRDGRLTSEHSSDLGPTGLFRRTTALKRLNPSLRVSVMIAGGFESLFPSLATLDAFVDDAVRFLRSYDFDGLDLDWEFPQTQYEFQFAVLVEKLREAFEAESKKSGKERLLLTSAVGCYATYDLKSLAKNFDFISLMAYDFHGAWEKKTDGQTNLYPNGNLCVESFIKRGFPPSKMVFGMGTYGRGFTLVNASQHGMGAPAKGPNKPAKFTRAKGIMAFYETCYNNWTEEFAPNRKVMYAYKGDQWISFENEKTIGIKAQFIIDKGLAGGMIWRLDFDDFRGEFCGKGKYPLLKAIDKVFSNDRKSNDADGVNKLLWRLMTQNRNSLIVL